MKNLWFKQCYVESILKKIKIDTIRKITSSLPDIDDEVSFSVGPRLPFAVATIIKKEVISISLVSASYKKELQKIYPSYSGDLILLTYKLKTYC